MVETTGTRSSLPTTIELARNLAAIVEREKTGPLNVFAFDLAKDIMNFLRSEYKRPFPQIHFHFMHGEAYGTALREAGVSEDLIAGTAGFYLGNKLAADVYFDLGDEGQYFIEGNFAGGIVRLVHVEMEELMHVLFPDAYDKDIWEEVIRLVEKYLTDFHFTEEQKSIIRISVSGEPRDGLFFPDSKSYTG